MPRYEKTIYILFAHNSSPHHDSTSLVRLMFSEVSFMYQASTIISQPQCNSDLQYVI